MARSNIDTLLREMAAGVGAADQSCPAAISRTTLEQFEYFESFPGRAVALPGSHHDFVPPALCYHLFDRLRGAVIDPPLILTTVGTCARNEEQTRPPFRLPTFTMREIVFLGSGRQVERLRQRLLRKTGLLANQRGLVTRIEAATDPFFIGGARGRELLQRLKGLKYELVIDRDGERVALASFNHHEDFFGRRMKISLPDGSYAHSGCAAFGLERWTAALHAHAA
jgi:hypothetical protein